MQLLYIDDSPEELFMVSNMLSRDPSIKLRTKGRLVGSISEQSDPPDCILVDVRRPDAFSLEDDVRYLRGVSNAPIIFVTGGEAEILRREALSVGADGLLQKQGMTCELIVQTVSNALLRTKPEQSDVAAGPQIPASDSMLQKAQKIARIGFGLANNLHDLAFQALENELPAQISCRTRMNAYIAEGLTELASFTEPRLLPVEVKDAIADIRPEIEDFGRTQKVGVNWTVSPGQWKQSGGYRTGMEGLRQLCLGVIGMMPKDANFLFTNDLDPMTGKMDIQIYASALLFGDHATLPQASGQRTVTTREAAGCFSIALCMLGVDLADVRIDNVGGVSVISLQL